MKVRRVRKATGEGVIGLDLSIRSPAGAWLPRDWDGDTTKVVVRGWPRESKEPPRTEEERIKELVRISVDVVEFCREFWPAPVFVEGYSYNAKGRSVINLGELGGVVRKDLYVVFGRVATPIPVTQGRKTLLQRVPRKDSKQWTEDNVRRLGGEALYWSGDQIDAVCVGNEGQRQLGWIPLSFPGIDL